MLHCSHGPTTPPPRSSSSSSRTALATTRRRPPRKPPCPPPPPPAILGRGEPACAAPDEPPPAWEAVEPVNRCRRCCVPLEPRVRQGFMRHAARDARRGQRHDHCPEFVAPILQPH